MGTDVVDMFEGERFVTVVVVGQEGEVGEGTAETPEDGASS